ncbi:MAG: molybdopterin-dependent oxidoreductase, partial [Nannocystaceae bacterium]
MDAEFAELIVLWGTNTLSSNLHFWPVVLRAKKRGARVVVIDPVQTKTAKAADQWIRIRPGTDAALALVRADLPELLHGCGGGARLRELLRLVLDGDAHSFLS